MDLKKIDLTFQLSLASVVFFQSSNNNVCLQTNFFFCVRFQLGSDQAYDSWWGFTARMDPGGEFQQSSAKANQANSEENLRQFNQHRQ